MELKRSSSHNIKQPFHKRVQDFSGWKKRIKIINDSNRQIVVIIEYRKTETIVNTKGGISAGNDLVKAHYEKETESLLLPPNPVRLVARAKETVKENVSENDFFVTITSEDESGNKYIHTENALMRSNEDWHFKQEHLEVYVRAENYKDETACRLCAFLQWLCSSSKFTQTQDNVS